MLSKNESEINRLYKRIFNEVFSGQTLKDLARGSRLGATQKLSVLSTSPKYIEFAQKFSAELAKRGLSKERGIWRKFFEAAKKEHYIALPATFREYEMQVLSAAIKENFKMIKSIPDRIMEIMEKKYLSTLIEEVAKGNLSRGAFKKQLETHAGKQAKVIARTESAKLQTAIRENRARNLGSVAYRWRSSNDKRTRPSHRAMNGVIVFWRDQSQKPLLDKMRGNAGEFPNCRCDTQPLFDESDLTQVSYEVYDYTTDTIITMYKDELLAALDAGEINY